MLYRGWKFPQSPRIKSYENENLYAKGVVETNLMPRFAVSEVLEATTKADGLVRFNIKFLSV